MLQPTISKKFMYSERQTKSTVFILPMLGKTFASYGIDLLNCYIGDTAREEYKENIILLFHFKGNIEFSNFENYLRSVDGYITDYEARKGFVCFVYDIPDAYYMDYLRFIRGKYSSFSPELKKIIVGDRPGGVSDKIFNKDASLKEHWEKKIGTSLKENEEVYPIPDMEEEILDYDRHFKRGN